MRKRKITYIMLLFFVLVLYIYNQRYLLFLILLILILVPALTANYTFLVSRYLTIALNIKESAAVHRDKAGFELTVNNSSVFPVSNVCIRMRFRYNNYEETMEHKFVLNAKSSDKTVVCGNILLDYCGVLEVSFQHVYVYDILKLSRFRLKIGEKKRIAIMPKLEEPDYYAMHMPYHATFDSQYYSKRTAGDDVSEIFDMREYRNGDSIARIHWKLSAKKESMVIKDFGMPIKKSDIILVELNRCNTSEERKNLDGIFGMVYAMGNFAWKKEQVFKIACYSEEIQDLKVMEVDTEKALIEALHILLQENGSLDNTASLKACQANLIQEAHRIYYITTGMSYEVIEFSKKIHDGSFFIYRIHDGSQEEEAIEIEGAMLFLVDRNHIKQSLDTIMM